MNKYTLRSGIPITSFKVRVPSGMTAAMWGAVVSSESWSSTEKIYALYYSSDEWAWLADTGNADTYFRQSHSAYPEMPFESIFKESKFKDE